MMRHTLPFALLLSLAALPSKALVNLDAGQRLVLGVQLLQDYAVPTDYYYLPTVPRLATRDDGTYELLCLKYVDADGPSGGLFHALIEFTLPAAAVQALEKELNKSVPSGRIVGPVPLMQALDKGEEGMGSFQIVSATLANRGDTGLTRTLVTSGGSPLTPGSKAVVAALLTPKGATLLWDSLNGGATSDVSVAIHAYYEAAVKGYDARVVADVSTVYKHLSEIANTQKDFTRRQIRDVMDDLQRNGTLQITVLDRTSGLGIKASDMDGILSVVTSKLTELMFDKTSGWSADPQREAAVESNQLLGRQERGWFSSVFGGAEDTKYFTDDQWVLKKRTDIRHNVFAISLAKNSTIKVPLDTAGNLGGIYRAMKDDPRYFRIVDMGDPAFESRTVHFQLDGSYLDAFQDTINFAAVTVRKRYGGDRPDFTRTLRFTADGLKAGRTVQEVVLRRLGEMDDGWTEYEYQVRWSLRDGPTLSVPADANGWIKSSDAAISLVPPFEKRVVELDADRQLFRSGGFSSALVQFMVQIGGDLKLQRPLTLRAADAESTARVALYHDRESPIAFSTSWYAPNRTSKGKAARLDQDYLFIVPPAAAPPAPPSPPAPAPGPALGSTSSHPDGGTP